MTRRVTWWITILMPLFMAGCARCRHPLPSVPSILCQPDENPVLVMRGRDATLAAWYECQRIILRASVEKKQD